jgi:hypothetical protein
MENGRQPDIKKWILLFLMGLLLLPIVQEKLQFVKVWRLGGWINVAPKPEITAEGWFSGDYQKAKEAYMNQKFGFRSGLVRLNNQLDYLFFRQANARGIFYGKEGVLFERLYTDAFYGLNYVGNQRIDSITDQIKGLQDRLEKEGKTFLMVFAAGKATYYEEYIPERYRLQKTNSNYKGFAEAMKKKGINHIDFNKWFLENKTKSQYPLFPELGIHWSIYGSALAFDSIQKWIEAKRHIDMPDFRIKGVEMPDTLRSPDDDIFQALNLLGTMHHSKMAYPVLEVKNDNSKYKPTVITVGDSFWWNIYNLGVSDNMFNSGQFWYYNKDLYRGGTTEIRHKGDINFRREIEGTEIVIFCYSEGTVHDMGNGFLDDLSNYYKNRDGTNQRDVDNFVKYIRSDRTWMERLQKESKETKTPLDSLIIRDARWQVKTILQQ